MIMNIKMYENLDWEHELDIKVFNLKGLGD